MYIHYSLVSPSAIENFDIVNFRDTTTSMDLEKKTAIFEFEFTPLFPLSRSLILNDFYIRLTWRSGAITAPSYIYANVRFKEIATNQYCLSVPLDYLGRDNLLMTLAVHVSCLWNYNGGYSRNQRQCRNGWQMRGTSDPLEISAKRG